MPQMGIEEIEILLKRGDYVQLHADGSVTIAERGGLKYQLEESQQMCASLLEELQKLKSLLNTPETDDFDKGVPLEAAHQIQRWGAAHDAGKNPEDWFWLCGYLAGKALASYKSGDTEKAKHHCVSTAAVMRNWHKAISTGNSDMRPGISGEKQAAGN